MSVGGILDRVFLAFWAFLLLWGNFEAWFRPEKVMGRMREDSKRLNALTPDFWPGKNDSWEEKANRWPWMKSIRWYRALVVMMDILAILFFYLVFTQGVGSR